MTAISDESDSALDYVGERNDTIDWSYPVSVDTTALDGDRRL